MEHVESLKAKKYLNSFFVLNICKNPSPASIQSLTRLNDFSKSFSRPPLTPPLQLSRTPTWAAKQQSTESCARPLVAHSSESDWHLVVYHPALMLLWFRRDIETNYPVKLKKLGIDGNIPVIHVFFCSRNYFKSVDNCSKSE